MDLSLVIPLLNERESLRALHEQIAAAVDPLGLTYELIFIDDGSSDGSWEVLTELHDADSRVKALQFRRNYGKSAALAAGFAEAAGAVVVTLDADLQDDPAEIPRLLGALDQGYDLVSGWKYPRRDPWSKRLPSKLFNKVVQWVTGIKLHDFNCGFKAYRQELAKELELHGELHRFVPVLARSSGYRVGEVTVNHRPRQFGKSRFGPRRLIAGLFDLLTVVFLTEYAARPLHLLGWPGILSLAGGTLITLYMAVLWFAGDRPIGTRPLFMLGILLLVMGVLFLCFGLVAELLVVRSGGGAVYRIKRRVT